MMVVETQEQRKVTAGHQEVTVVEQRGYVVDQISVAAAQKGDIAPKWTEFEMPQTGTEVGSVARKESALQSIDVASDPQGWLKQNEKDPRKVEDVSAMGH